MSTSPVTCKLPGFVELTGILPDIRITLNTSSIERVDGCCIHTKTGETIIVWESYEEIVFAMAEAMEREKVEYYLAEEPAP
jgi:hypothetical protein